MATKFLKEKKLSGGWTRDTVQENGSVFRWYEKGDIIASIVETQFPNEAEYRISGNFGSLSSRGDKHKILGNSDARNIKKIETLIRREKFK